MLNGSQVHWTTDLEVAAKKDGLKGVQENFKMLQDQLQETVACVRQKLTKLQSITLGALIVIDVHAKDTIQRLVDMKISDIGAFEWISTLRYYWPEDEDNCRVKMI